MIWEVPDRSDRYRCRDRYRYRRISYYTGTGAGTGTGTGTGAGAGARSRCRSVYTGPAVYFFSLFRPRGPRPNYSCI